MSTTVDRATVIGPDDGPLYQLATLGVRPMIPGAVTERRFSLVEHPMPPRALAAPLHRHTNEDEYSFVLEGRMGALLGDDVVYAGPGDLVYKPRGQWHTFWNASDEPARILELISPAGFEEYFRELAQLMASPSPDPAAIGALHAKYSLEMRRDSVPDICKRFGVWFPGAEESRPAD